MRQEVKNYLDGILNQGLVKNYWFMTKQTMTDYYFIFTQAKVVETFNSKRLSNENFGAYYARFFREDSELNTKYPAQGSSENTYRNAISAESLGFFYRETDKYDSGVITPAYKVLARYVKDYSDSLKYRFLFERQIEKLCLNVNPKLGNYVDLQGVRNFPVMFLYKILLELQKRTGDSTLKYEEFVVFLFRTKKYCEWENALNLILWYRSEGLDSEYREKFNQVYNDITAENIRFDTLIGNLSNIIYTDKKHGHYYKIKDSYESLRYIENAVEIFEASRYVDESNPGVLLDFLRSDKYFIGNLDTAFMVAEVPEEELESGNSDLEKIVLEHWNLKDFDYKEIDNPLSDFKAMFGKDVIENMTDEECLLKLFGKKEELSLVYYLEHVDKYWYFGRISNYRHNYILYEKDGSWRYATSAKSITEIDVDEAKKYAAKFRDMFVSLFNKIENYIADESLKTIEGYEKLYSETKTILGVFYNKNWVWKYIYLLYPEFFIPFYSNEWVSKMFRVAQLVPGNNYVLQCGQFTVFSRKLGISPIYVYKILCLIDDSEIEENEGTEEEESEEVMIELPERSPRTYKQYPLNLILYGAPGTGKTYSTMELTCAIFDKKTTSIDDICEGNTHVNREEVMERYNSLVKQGFITFTTFHQSYGYEDFIQGLRPDDKSDSLKFIPVDGVFKKIVNKAINDQVNNYVIIIDEINRANISKVLGELITLLETDKRWGEINQLSTKLPSGQSFAVPNNLYVIGTMNSADKSISLIDAALRRRFEFIEVSVNYKTIANITVRNVLKKINEKLEGQLDSSDLLVGHAYFIGKDENGICDVLNHNVVPLLYEYFFDSKAKVKDVLKYALDGLNYDIVDESGRRLKVVKKD